MNSTRTIQELRRHLTDFERVLLDWKQAIRNERRAVGIETLRNREETDAETIPLERLDCREMLKMSLMVERIEFMELELDDMNRDILKLEKLEKNLYSV